MKSNNIFIVDGVHEVTEKEYLYEYNKSDWENKCRNIDYSFVEKTSTVTTSAGNTKKYKNWYLRLTDGRLNIIGKDKPDFTTYYPDEPVKPYIPDLEPIKNGSHLVMPLELFKEHKDLFKKCFCFPMQGRIK